MTEKVSIKDLERTMYRNFGFSHQGVPAAFGSLSAGIVITSLIILIRLLRTYPLQDNEVLS